MNDCVPQPAAGAVPSTDRPVTEVIPHRPPFLLIDRIVEARPGCFAVSRYDVRPDHPVFEGHFPDFAVLPGVLLVENMAQTACWVLAARADAPRRALHVLARIQQCTFRRMVRPGDALTTEARLTRDLGQFALFDCRVHVGQGCAATAELLVARRDPDAPPGGPPAPSAAAPTAS